MVGKICQICNQKAAKLHITQIQGGEVQEFHFCPDCAADHGLTHVEGKTGPSLHQLLEAVTQGEEAARPTPTEPIKTCPGCGQTFRGFRESGRLGCGQCYETFEMELEPLLRKVQTKIVHQGKAPGAPVIMKESTDSIILRKKEQLKIAVSQEDFELAARLRDEIRELVGKSGHDPG